MHNYTTIPLFVAHQKEGIDRTQKSFLAAKKSFLWFRGFRTFFLLLATPYVMFESKKSQILIAHQKEGIDRTQKSFLAAKKVPLGFSGFRAGFFAVDHPLCDV